MLDSDYLMRKLNEKIEDLLNRYEHLKSENRMLRDELRITKQNLEQSQEIIQTLENSNTIDTNALNKLLETLEDALEND